MRVPDRFSAVAEFHGPYGPYHVSELVLQRIWLERAFDETDLRDQWGREVLVEETGQWNRLDGPDFRGAVLSIGGERLVGDVEVHFSQSDWRDHGHGYDEAYNRVILHVVYHPLKPGERSAERADGEVLPCVSLLPRLWYSLEEYACEDSIVSSTGVDVASELRGLLERGESDRMEVLVEAARRRWEMKRHFCGLRIERLGWDGACHQTGLEVLGYARNRVPMLKVAERYPLESLMDGETSAADLWDAGGTRWRMSGCRPANHPMRRLEQYVEWVSRRPCWPALLREIGDRLDFDEAEVDASRISELRKTFSLKALRTVFENGVTGESIGGMKLDTLICDGFLPLIASQGEEGLFGIWFAWYCGNAPERSVEVLRKAGILGRGKSALCNGWLQGLLGLQAAAKGEA